MRFELTRNGIVIQKGGFELCRRAFFALLLKKWSKTDKLRVTDKVTGRVLLSQN